MVMRQQSVVELAHDVLIPGYAQQRTVLEEIDGWYRWKPEPVKVPAKADQEQKYLRALSETPWLSLVVTTVAQQLVAESIRSTDQMDVAALWRPWVRNRMPSRQRAIHRAALAYGYAYATVLPGDTGATIRGYSPRDMFAVYQDPVVDDYPMYYVRVVGNRFVVVDDEAVHTLVSQRGKLEYVDHQIHGVGVAPAIRYSNQIDLEGRVPGEIEPLIPLAKRINQTSYDRLLTQRFNSWRVLTATGLEDPGTDEDREKTKLMLRQQDILTGAGEVQFGSLPATDLDGFNKSWAADVEALAAVSQTPAHAMTGKMSNLSADAITEARSILDLKANERKIGFGDSHAQVLRLAAHVEGRRDDSQDFSLSVQWADLGSRSMSQAADALGKFAAQLGVPQEMLWDRIPGVSKDETEMWKRHKREHPDEAELIARALARQADGTDTAR